MAGRVEELVHRAAAAAKDLDPAAAAEVEAFDDWVDDRDYAIEAAALEIISLQQPRGEDLRSLAAVMRMSRDLERIADYAVDLARAVPRLSAAVGGVIPDALGRMAHRVGEMLAEDGEAFRESDVDRAAQVARMDDAVDQAFRRLREELIEVMQADPRRVDAASAHLLLGQFLERSADHAVNVAEMIVYRLTGQLRPFRRQAP